uniref:Family with sequence similarity 149 member A n=1 Tax=Latimeria chalumnae TaxID=7897 RepID=H3ALF9_LATCH
FFIFRKGLSRGVVNHHNFQGKTEESLPTNFTKRILGAIQSYNSDSVAFESLSSESTPTDLNNSWSGIQSYTTGLSTERSSVYSWRDDEFDKANTQKVHQLFWYVDELLFEGKVSSCTQNLQTECSEWTKRSPHLRILGKQLLLPKDEGFQLFQSRANSTATTRSLPSFCESINNVKELSLSGQRLVPTASPLHQAFHSSGSSGFCDLSAYSFLQEEVYDMDGKIEEYFAYDNKEFDDEGLEQKRVHLGRKRNKRGIPPISPNSCMNDTVAAEIFDDVWRDVVEMLEELIRKHWESALTAEAKKKKKLIKIAESLNSLLNLVSRMQAETLSVPSSRGCDARSISSGSQFILAQVYRMMNTSHSDLNGVMTIQAKPLQQRNGGLMEKTQNEHEEKLLSTGSGVLTSVKNRLSRIADHSILSASRVMQTPSRRPPLQRKLPSIAPEQFRSKALNVYSDRVLRGTRLYTGLDHISSSSIQNARVMSLPPINSETVDQQISVPRSRHVFHRARYPHSRVSSAVPDSTGRRPLRERPVTVEHFSRPNTTHTFRLVLPHGSLELVDLHKHSSVNVSMLSGSHFQPKSFSKNPTNTRKRFQMVT